MHNAETVSRAIQVLNLDACHWRAGCGESRTSGSEGGRRKSAPGNRGNSPAAYPTTDPEGQGFTPQLISQGFFEAVQERLASKKARWDGKGPRYMMTGFTKCGKCGSPVVVGMMARGNQYNRCTSTRMRPEKPPTCDAKYIRAGLLAGVVWEMISEAIRHPEILSQEVQRHVQTGDGDLGERMTKLRREIADLKSQQRRLIELRQKDIIDQDILEA